MSGDAAAELAILARELEELNRIGAALSEERDVGALLDLILTKAREITSSNAGSLYLVGPDGAHLKSDRRCASAAGGLADPSGSAAPSQFFRASSGDIMVRLTPCHICESTGWRARSR